MAFEDLYRQESKIDCLVFDLDDTLYPLSSGLANAVPKNIGDYMVEKLGIDRSKIAQLCDLLYKNYGTTMAGLRAIGYSFNYDDYHSFVHGRLPYENLKPDPVLRNLLLSLPIRKVIFTNADKIHAAKALSKLGLEDCFEGIICFETLNSPIEAEPVNEANIFDIVKYSSSTNPGMELPKTPIVCKPSEYAVEHALKIANIDPQRAIFFDDSVRNVKAGKRVGLRTVLMIWSVGVHKFCKYLRSDLELIRADDYDYDRLPVGKSHRVKGADYALESIHNIREALPELWEEAEKSGDIRYSGKVTIETPVTA